MKYCLSIVIWIFIAKTSFGESIPPSPGVDVFESEFSMYQTNNGEYDSLNFKDKILNNYLVERGFSPLVRMFMYKDSRCGQRAYQYISVKSKSDLNLVVFFNCEDECIGIQNGSSSFYNPSILPREFCQVLWKNSEKLENKHGI